MTSTPLPRKADIGCLLYTSNMAVAQLWEFYEYVMLIFFKNDCINHYTQGVHDSNTDMLCATAVSYTHLDVYKRQMGYRVKATSPCFKNKEKDH